MMSIPSSPIPKIEYRDRQTGTVVSEKIFAESTLHWLYEDSLGVKVFNLLCNNMIFCSLFGQWQSSPWSRQEIPKFVAKYGIEIQEAELPLQSYQSLNAFFTRRLKLEARPFNTDPNVFCAPGDGKILVYPKFAEEDRLPVKGSQVTISSLLASDAAAQHYRGGSALILRLVPYDYHRFHFPVDGEAGLARYIKGQYHSVSPVALAKVPDLYCRNKRTVTEFHSKQFGPITYIEVGAFTIGSIVQTYTPGLVTKGQEKGYFQYGGSTLILLFEPGAIAFDQDLILDSANNLEVRVLAGSRIGISI
jgi:phosphatidylserine decarboxylase